MDRRERIDDPVEATRAALDGWQAELWTAMPGLVESFDPVAMTVAVQPALKGRMEGEDGIIRPVTMPLLVDVPVVFPSGGGFTLTHPIAKGDECLVIFAARCIDGWWQSGEVAGIADERMHDLSDGFALVGPRSQPRRLNPAVDADNVQLRTDDGRAHITMMPDYTIRALNPECSATLAPDGTITSRNQASTLTMTPAGDVTLRADASITLAAPLIRLQGMLSATALDGQSSTTATFKGDIHQDGSHTSTGDQVAGGVSQMGHVHPGCQGGSTGAPR